MSGVKTRLEQTTDDTKGVESLRLEMERCQRELEACRLRLEELEQGEALLAGENRLLEMVAKGEALPSILDGICRLVEEISSRSLCSILLLDANGGRLWHGAAPSLPKSYTEAIDGGLIGPRSGSCGTAAYRGERVIVPDIATDPLWDQYRHLAIDHGLRACWSTPIFSTTRGVMGTFALYSREPGSPTLEQLNLIDQMTHLAAVAIERERAAEALRASEHLARGQLDALTHTLDSLAEESDPDRLLEHVLRTIVEQTGAHSVSAWERNEDGDWLELVAVIESGRFQTPKDAVHPAARILMLAQNHPVWSEVFRTRQYAVLEDIDQECARSRVGSDPDAVWHRVMEEGLLRIPQESLTNTIKHAKAKTFRATLTIAPNEIQFRLVDDGVGFDLHAEHEGFGLVGMKERVDQIGGQFILRSMPDQ